ncbi:MAG: hypothetical protein ABUS57_00005 [Pseudomonadota bacterium]
MQSIQPSALSDGICNAGTCTFSTCFSDRDSREVALLRLGEEMIRIVKSAFANSRSRISQELGDLGIVCSSENLQPIFKVGDRASLVLKLSDDGISERRGIEPAGVREISTCTLCGRQ